MGAGQCSTLPCAAPERRLASFIKFLFWFDVLSFSGNSTAVAAGDEG